MTDTKTRSEQIVRDLIVDINPGGDLDAATTLVSDDVYFKFANAPAVTGKADFRAAVAQFQSTLQEIDHELIELWVADERVVFTRLDVHYTRLDGSKLTLPCMNIFTLDENDKVQKYEIFMDVTPLFAQES